METLKLIISVILLCFQYSCSVKHTAVTLYKDIFCRPSDTILLAVPGLLYIIQDNLVIYALSCIDAPTYTVLYVEFKVIGIRYQLIDQQVTYQSRILMTAFFAKILLRKHLNYLHWIALTLLTIGVVLAQVRHHHSITVVTVIGLMTCFFADSKVPNWRTPRRFVIPFTCWGSPIHLGSHGRQQCRID